MATGPVECLGLTFENNQARRDHFMALLKEKLQDPEFRKIPGFPQGSDEAILRMSDPPYYTACPNPFLEEFIRCYGKPYDQNEVYEREPFAVDVSVGKTDQLYKAHGYHTKVPHLAIVPSILHYTRPGDIVLDGFCGSGMTGLAAQWCGSAPSDYKEAVDSEWKKQGRLPAKWGTRKAILSDLSPCASVLSAGFNLPFSLEDFSASAQLILQEVNEECGWMYQTLDPQTGIRGRISNTVWSTVFSCPECMGEIVFAREAMDISTGSAKDAFHCPSCGVSLKKKDLDLAFESSPDPLTGDPWKRLRLVPVLINYSIGELALEKVPDTNDLDLIETIKQQRFSPEIPSDIFPFDEMWEATRLKGKGITRVHHLFLPRSAIVISKLWQKANNCQARSDVKRMLQFWIDSHMVNLSIRNRHRPNVSFPYNPMSGVYYIGSMISEPDFFPAYVNKEKAIRRAFSRSAPARSGACIIGTTSCCAISLPPACVDYVFTDPPFGDNFAYWELNYAIEPWYGVKTSQRHEIAVDRGKVNREAQKSTLDYQALMTSAMREYFRVLKPGRWITVVFSNSKNAVWRALQEAIGGAGFVIADVRSLDKQERSFKQVTSAAVKQDLVISAYKPTRELEACFELASSTEDSAWIFVKEHLRNVPIFVSAENQAEVLAERTPHMLLDRMIAFHVQHGVSVPLSGGDFLQGLSHRFPQRDGMYFLPDQVTEYDRKRTSATQLRQLSFFVNDEHSAIQWIRQQLQDKPQSFQDLQPQFMRELQAWAKHEQTVELKLILEQNFLHFEGRGPVPSQIHSYLSSNFKDLRNLSKEDPKLIEKAQDRWYVPDPNNQANLDQFRDRALLKEFEEVKESSQRKIKLFRTEAVRAGFKACWQERDYATIVKVAAKLPEAVLQEDEKLLMYVDNAQTRLGDEE